MRKYACDHVKDKKKNTKIIDVSCQLMSIFVAQLWTSMLYSISIVY